MPSKVFLIIFFIQIKIPNRKRNPETLFQRKFLLFFIRKNQFYMQFLKLNFQADDLNLRIKSLKLKRFYVNNCCQISLMWHFYRFFANF